MPKKGSPMNRSAANPAAMPVKQPVAVPTEHPAKCLTLFALSAEHPARFLSSPEMTVLFIAASASLTEDNYYRHYKERSVWNALFFLLSINAQQVSFNFYYRLDARSKALFFSLLCHISNKDKEYGRKRFSICDFNFCVAYLESPLFQN